MGGLYRRTRGSRYRRFSGTIPILILVWETAHLISSIDECRAYFYTIATHNGMTFYPVDSEWLIPQQMRLNSKGLWSFRPGTVNDSPGAPRTYHKFSLNCTRPEPLMICTGIERGELVCSRRHRWRPSAATIDRTYPSTDTLA